MSKKTFSILLGIMTAVIILLAGMNISAANENTWDVCYKMPNQNVEWTGAGYSGIWGR